MRKLAILILPALLLGLGARTARADEEWYGWQILVADGLSTGLMIAGARSEGLTAVGLGGYFLAGPIIHGAHGDMPQAIADLGLRAGLPVAGLYLGNALDTNRDAEIPAGAILGLLGGGVTAMVIDYAALSRHVRPEEPRTLAGVAPTKGGAIVSLTGRF